MLLNISCSYFEKRKRFSLAIKNRQKMVSDFNNETEGVHFQNGRLIKFLCGRVIYGFICHSEHAVKTKFRLQPKRCYFLVDISSKALITYLLCFLKTPITGS